MRRLMVLFFAFAVFTLGAGGFSQGAEAATTGCYGYGYTPYKGAGGPYIFYGYGFSNCLHDTIKIEGKLQQLGQDGLWHDATGYASYYSGYSSVNQKDFSRSVSCHTSSVNRRFRTKVRYGSSLLPDVDVSNRMHTAYSYEGSMLITCL